MIDWREPQNLLDYYRKSWTLSLILSGDELSLNKMKGNCPDSHQGTKAQRIENLQLELVPWSEGGLVAQ